MAGFLFSKTSNSSVDIKDKIASLCWFLGFWLLWTSYLLQAKSLLVHEIIPWRKASFVSSWQDQKKMHLAFWVSSRHQVQRGPGFSLLLVGRFEACLVFSRSYRVKWNNVGGRERFGSTWLHSLFSLTLDVHQACLERGRKPKIACSWVRSGTQSLSAGKLPPPTPALRIPTLTFPRPWHIWYSYVLNIKCKLWKQYGKHSLCILKHANWNQTWGPHFF